MRRFEYFLEKTVLNPSSAEGIAFCGVDFAVLTALALIFVRLVVRRVRRHRESRLDTAAHLPAPKGSTFPVAAA